MYVLVILLAGAAGVSAEFATKATCDAAREEITSTWKSQKIWGSPIMAICVAK